MLKGLQTLVVALVCAGVCQAGPFIATFDQASNVILNNETLSTPYAYLMLDDSTTDGALAINQVRMRVEIANNNPAEFRRVGWNLAAGVTASDFAISGTPTGTGTGNAALWSLDTNPSGTPMPPFDKFAVTIEGNGNNLLTSLNFLMLFDDPSKAKISSFQMANAGGYLYGMEYRPTKGGSGNVAAVPEPSSILLAGMAGALGLTAAWKRRRFFK